MGRPKKRQRTEDEPVAELRSRGRRSTNGSGELAQRSNQQEWDTAVPERLGFENCRTGDGGIDGYLTPGGSLQPWLQAAENEGAMPGLTPDSSSNSPPMINLPPELQSNDYPNGHAHNPSTQLPLDASLTGTDLGLPPSVLPTCACLSTMYLTLNTLQSLSTFAFPFTLHPLREAMQTASEVLSCEYCPTKFLSAVHNTQLAGTLLVSIAERFSRVLESITSEAIRAERANERKKFRLTDLNTGTSHLHTGGLGCAAAFSIDLSPAEWRSMSKKVVRAEVHGPADGVDCCPYFVGLTRRMIDRQQVWHGKDYVLPDDFPTDQHGEPIGGPRMPKEDHVCLRVAGYADKLVDGFDWS